MLSEWDVVLREGRNSKDGLSDEPCPTTLSENKSVGRSLSLVTVRPNPSLSAFATPKFRLRNEGEIRHSFGVKIFSRLKTSERYTLSFNLALPPKRKQGRN